MQDEASGGDGLDSGLTQVSFNAVLWAFAYNGRLDVAWDMYRVVRARANIAAADVSEELEEREELEEFERTLAEREMIVIARDVVPDAATYHTLIQAYAYQGDLRACLDTLSDMLSAPPPPLYHHHHEHQAKENGNGKDKGQRRQFTASLPAFRSIFLGFARHGVVATAASSNPPPTIYEDGEEETYSLQWTLPALKALFARFLDLPHDTPLREPTLFWLVSAFLRTSGHHQDSSSLLLRSVFERVEARFGSSALRLTQGDDSSRCGRLARIRERVFSGSSL
jgi:pentatricopeptide repeat protein